MTVHWLVTNDPDYFGWVRASNVVERQWLGTLIREGAWSDSVTGKTKTACKQWMEDRIPEHLTRRWVTVEEEE